MPRGAVSESIRHVLMECTIAKRFWEVTKAGTGVKLPALHPETWAHDLAEGPQVTEAEQQVIIIGMYALWSQRNKRRHGEVVPPIEIAVRWATDLAFDLGQVFLHQTPMPTTRHEPIWEHPPQGWLKCNVDGAFYDRSGSGATGAVLRDSSGTFVRGGAKWYDHSLDALTMEAIACRDGLALAIQSGARKIWLETDCQQLVQLWQSGSYQRSSIAPYLQEMLEQSLVFLDFKLSFISRTCNKIAHVLAKRVTGDTRAAWWTRVPAYVSNLLTENCNQPPRE